MSDREEGGKKRGRREEGGVRREKRKEGMKS